MYGHLENILENKVDLLGILLIFLPVLVGLTGCSGPDDFVVGEKEWKYDQLRAIDPVDAELPNLDIVAVYLAVDATYLSIRIDLLDIESYDPQHVFIMVDYTPGGSNIYPFDFHKPTKNYRLWDIAIELSPEGEIKGFDSRGEKLLGLQASTYKDTVLDIITVNISKGDLLPKRSLYRLEIFTLEPSSGIVIDSVTSINSAGMPPSPAQVLLGFWNIYPAYSPAQVLRKWDGAHSGPLSSRYGLRHLVEWSEFYGMSLTLFDVGVRPASVALDFLGVVDGVSRLVFSGLDFECVGGIGYAKNISNQAVYALSVDTRAQLVEAAMTGERICIGGDFSQSLWGIPSASEQVFRYIKAHPWIITINTTNLQSNRTDINNWNYCPGDPQSIYEIDLVDPMLSDNFQKQYKSAPENLLKTLAFQTYQTILCPANPLDRKILDSYFGQLGHILSAAEWVEKPTSISRCDVDLDWDGDNECVLASESIYLTAELKGGYLSFAFFKDNDTVHQIMSPMYEVVVGLGDPLAYNPEVGVFADAKLIPGALAVSDHYNEYFRVTHDKDVIELDSDTLKLTITISINANEIHLKWISDEPINFQIPLILDPWLRYTPDWSSQYLKWVQNGDHVWGINNQFEIVLETSAEAEFDTFLDSKPYLDQPENPNFEYPDGHYLPFPTAILDLSPSETGFVELVLMKP